MLDLGPATSTLASLVRGVRDDQLEAPTPCTDTPVGSLLTHVDGFCQAFTAAAQKTPLAADDTALGDDWRERLPKRLDALAEAWRDGSAWEGMAEAGGQTSPAEVMGLVALDEVIVHGWDIAVASGQPYEVDDALVQAVRGFVEPTASANPDGVPGLFGPAVPVADNAPPLDRLLGLTGRDPRWRP